MQLVVPCELLGLPLTLTVVEAAGLLRIGRNQAYEAVASGTLPAMRIGRRWVIPTVRLLRLAAPGCSGRGGYRRCVLGRTQPELRGSSFGHTSLLYSANTLKLRISS
ncbi:MAG: helix-turn-helix domain-containing protein [Egibacteraceae bacterium]